jgi:hypothetical protein
MRARGLTMPGGVKLIGSTLVIVLHNGEQEIERELASPADALRVALIMLARGAIVEQPQSAHRLWRGASH